MKLSLEWLRDYVELPEEAGEIASRLTAAGLHVEAIETVGDDRVFEIEITPNRPDCMNHVGVARELAALFDRELRLPGAGLTPGDGTAPLRITLIDSEGCPRYVGVGVADLAVGESPEWLRRRLEAIGQRAVNNVVDVTNYVLWELGQPLHAFDLDRIAGGEIRVRRAAPGEKLTTLDGVERELDEEVLVIADAERALALAGIMGGQDSEVRRETRRILIESAHFDRRRVRRGSRRVDLHTDASHRFERGSDPAICRFAAERAAGLLAELAGGRPLGPTIDARGAAIPEIPWRIESERLAEFAGATLSEAEIAGRLGRLGFAPRAVEPGVWEGIVPTWRNADFAPRDIERRGVRRHEAWPADVYEELLRTHGLDAIPARLPSLAGTDLGVSVLHAPGVKVRLMLSSSGLAEAIHFAFHDAASDDRFPKLAAHGEPLALANALSERYAVMRRSLLPNLLSSAAFNARRGAGAVRLFEIGSLFPGGRDEEIVAVAILLGGRVGSPWDRRAELDFFHLKGILEALAERFGRRLTLRPARLAGFVEGASAELLDETGVVAGHAGRVEGDETPFPLFAAELALARLVDGPGRPSEVVLPPRLPGIDVDTTLTHRLDTSWSELATAIEAAGIQDLREFGLKDRYRGPGVPTDCVATTIAFRYNAEERSLTQEEVNARHAPLAAELERRFGAGRREPQ